MLVAEGGLLLRSVLDLLSDDAAGLDSALPPSFEIFFGDTFFGDVVVDVSFDAVVDSLAADSFVPDSALAAFFRASDG